MGRIGDAVRTLLQPSWDSKIKAMHAELRQMIDEFADQQEKFSMLLAREAKRRQRDQKKLLDPPADVTPETPTPAPEPLSRKDEIWRRFRSQGGRPPLAIEETGT